MTVHYGVNSNRQTLHVKRLEDSRKYVSLKTLLSANGKYYKYACFVFCFAICKNYLTTDILSSVCLLSKKISFINF